LEDNIPYLYIFPCFCVNWFRSVPSGIGVKGSSVDLFNLY